MASAAVPAKLKAIAHYVKIAYEYADRDPAVFYWSLLYGVQKGMQIDKSSPECKQYLMQNLSLLEQTKTKNRENEAISNEVIASAHVEEVALKLFTYADIEDRASRFNKNVVKAFYTAGYLFDVLGVFGDVDSQIVQQQKYAKWKAAYIHNCLKNGETPMPGPVGGEEGFGDEFGGEAAAAGGGQYTDTTFPVPPSSTLNPAPMPTSNPMPSTVSAPAMPTNTGGDSGLQTADFMKAQKLCKYAISALEYEDAQTAVENLKQALALLQVSRN